MTGKYIVIEGSDGTGKTTQVNLLIDWLAQRGIKAISIHEPGGTPISEELSRIIKNPDLERSPLTNALLFTAARVELWPKIESILNQSDWVISSRNYLSTLVYQGLAEGIGVEKVLDLSKQFLPSAYLEPDQTIVLLADQSVAKNRRDIRNNGKLDTFEAKDENFFTKITTGYQQISSDFQLQTVNTNDKTPEQVFAEIIPILEKLL